MRVAAWCLMLGVAVGSSDTAFGDVVRRRGAEPQLTGRVVGIDEAGVKIATDAGAQHLVSWDRVRSIDSPFPNPEAERFKALADSAWRARTRLERGDHSSAEGLFERLFAEMRGQTHETALVVAEGLLRCRLARGRNDGAVIPWLEAARLRRAGVTTNSYRSLPPVVDSQTLLCPALPPAWLPGSRLDAVVKDLDSYRCGDPLITWFALAYEAAAGRAAGIDVSTAIPTEPDQAGAKLLRAWLEMSDPNEQRRVEARAAMRARLSETAGWSRAWSHALLGLSLLNDQSEHARQEGLLELVHLPASFAKDQPYLHALALTHLATAAATSDAGAAAHFRDELKSHFPQLTTTVGTGGPRPASQPSGERSP